LGLCMVLTNLTIFSLGIVMIVWSTKADGLSDIDFSNTEQILDSW
jgi:hypothetical protein